MSEKNLLGGQLYTYETVLGEVAWDFYLSPDRVQHIYLAENKKVEEEKTNQVKQQELF